MTMLSRACARNAVSRWSLAGTALILLLGALPPLPELPGFTLGQRLAAVVAALVPSLGLLVLARMTWLAHGSRWATPISALLTFATAGALAGATRGWAATALGVDLPVGAAWRVPSTAVAAALWLSLMAVAVDFMRAHLQTMRTLRAEEATLAAIDSVMANPPVPPTEAWADIRWTAPDGEDEEDEVIHFVFEDATTGATDRGTSGDNRKAGTASR